MSSDKGKVKSRNEDHFSILQPSYSGQPYFVAVSDGVGGRRGGQLASVRVLQIIGAYVTMNTITQSNIKEKITHAISKSNDDLISTGKEYKELAGMGTTIVLCVMLDNICNFFSIGDSRGYIIDKYSHIKQVTVDHTWTNELVSNGSITDTQARTHPHRHRLMKAVGVSDSVKPDYFKISIDDIEWIILCTDGLTEHVSDKQILAITKKNLSAQETADQLTKLSLRRGGTDNVTVVVCKMIRF